MKTKRNLYLTNMPVEESLDKFYEHLSFVPEHETIEVIKSLGRVLARPVFAEISSPYSDSCAMDGIAVVSEKTAFASETNPITLVEGVDYKQVNTGNALEQPFDAMIMAEDIEEQENGTVIIRSAATPWQHIRPIGEDIIQGEMIVPTGHKIRPFDIGAILSGGVSQVVVKKQPRVAIIPTGSELVEVGNKIERGQVIESNSYMLEALVTESEAVPTKYPKVKDNYETIKNILLDAVQKHDLVLLGAGTSAGTEDYTVSVIKELGQVLVHGVAIKPGKPVILAIIENTPVIGIPGYPVSAYVTFENFIKPVIENIYGNNHTKNNIITATLTRRLVSSFKYKEYVRVKLGKIGEKLIATPLSRGAGSNMSLVRSDGLLIIPLQTEGLEAGEQVQILLNKSVEDLDRTLVSIGSHDLIMDIIGDMLNETVLSSSHVGSLGGLMAIKNGETHIAPSHQIDEETGVYNIPIVKRLFGSENKMAIIKGVGRIQGLMVKKGNPLGVKSLEDLAEKNIKYINRQRGAGTRMLLDYKLNQLGIDHEKIKGYDREAATHMAVAAAIQGDSADCGMGIESAAKAMGLDFIVIDNEEYDFVIKQEFLNLPHVQAFIDVLKSDVFKNRIKELSGYTVENCGDIIYIT